MSEIQFLDLSHGELVTSLLIDLGVGVDGLFRGHRQERGADGKDFFREFGGIAFCGGGQVCEDLAVSGSGGGRGEVQGVGDQSGHEETGDGFWDGYTGLLEAHGDDAARGAHRVVPEQNRGVARKAAQFVVIENLDDGHLVGSAHGLGEFVVIHQNELPRDFLQKIGFGEDSHESALVIEHGKNECSRFCSDVAGFAQEGVFVETGVLGFEHSADANGAASKEYGAGRVVGGTNQGDIRLTRCGPDFFGDWKSAGHDDGVEVFFYAQVLDMWAVADKENDLAIPVALDAWSEGFEGHGAYHEQEFMGFGWKAACDQSASEGGDHVGQRSGNEPSGGGFFP